MRNVRPQTGTVFRVGWLLLALTIGLVRTTASGAQAGSSGSAASGPRFTRHFLPNGLLYRSYLAGEKEPRVGAVWLHQPEVGWIWEAAMGLRIGLLRYGTDDDVRPEGFQLDVEGAAFTRVDVGVGTDVDSIDFRTGFLMTWRSGRTALKGGTYHISSHIGDEYIERNPDFVRLDYVRDSFIGGATQDLTDTVSVYGEAGYAFKRQGGAEPWEVQFGVQYNPTERMGWTGRPFAAINAHLRQEFDFGGSLNIVAGWQWRSTETRRALRWGVQYFNGKALQYSFFDQHEQWTGTGIWLDF